MNASHLENDALDISEKIPGTVHVTHFPAASQNESTRGLCLLLSMFLIGFFGKRMQPLFTAKTTGASGRFI